MDKYTIKKNSSYGDGGFIVLDKKNGRVLKKVKNRKQAKKHIEKLKEEDRS